MNNTIRTMALVAAATLSLTACSGGTDDAAGDAGAPAAAGSVEFVGNGSVQWAETELAATATEGSLAATLTCEGAVPHNVVIEGVDGDAVLAECAGDDAADFTLAVEPGTYTFYCAIPGHREAGMEGTLTVS